MSAYDVVIPTVGRPSLDRLLAALARTTGPPPGRVLLVDDRRRPGPPLVPEASLSRRGLPFSLEVLRGPGAGPAAARNVGWRAAQAEWVAFLDDDVVPAEDWPARLAEDLAGAPSDVAGVQGRIDVPVSAGRPTDWERNVRGLEAARWATADMAYRRSALEAVGGFDERFPRAYREDADLALRVIASGARLAVGTRRVSHPVRPADPWVSVKLQAGNQDDVLMLALHGPGWKARAGVPSGGRPRHLITTALAVVAVASAAARRRRAAATGLAGWLASTAALAWARTRPGPRDRREVATMLATSAVLPAAATWHWLRGWLRWGPLAATTMTARWTGSRRPAASAQTSAVHEGLVRSTPTREEAA